MTGAVINAGALLGDLALALAGLVFGDDVGGHAHDRAGGRADGDGLSGARARGAGEAAGEDAGAAAEDGGVLAGRHVFAAGDGEGDGGGEGEGWGGAGVHKE